MVLCASDFIVDEQLTHTKQCRRWLLIEGAMRGSPNRMSIQEQSKGAGAGAQRILNVT
jgi:hypothetical protein